MKFRLVYKLKHAIRCDPRYSLFNVLLFSFNLEAASNFIRNSGVQEEQPVVITKSSKHSSSSSKPNKSNKSNNSSSDTATSLTTSDDRDFSADPPPDVKRTVTTTSATSASDSIISPRSKGKLEEIIDSYRTSGAQSSAVASGSSTLLSGVSDATAGSVSPTASVVSTKCYQEDLKNFNDSNLEFLYEAFPDLKQEYCKMWLRRYNGDLVKTCDYLTRVSQVELPQHEDEDVVELGAEDIEMIDLTQDVEDEDDDDNDEDDDDDDVIVEEDEEQGIIHFLNFHINFDSCAFLYLLRILLFRILSQYNYKQIVFINTVCFVPNGFRKSLDLVQ